MDGGREADLMPLVLAAEVAFLVSVGLAARTRRTLRPLLALGACAYLNELLTDAIARHLRVAPRPLAGADRILYHVHGAVQLGWLAAVAAVALWVLVSPARRRRAVAYVLLAWAALAVSLAVAHPLSRAGVRLAFWGAEASTCAITAAAAIWTWGHTAWKREQVTALTFAGAEFVNATVGPYATNPFRDWHVAQWVYIAEFAGMAAWHAFR